jgi:exoribonuclease R
MTRRLRIHPALDRAELTGDFDRARAALGITVAFPAEVEEAALVAIAAGPAGPPRSDRTAIPLVTIDPPGSRDLDQALHVEERGDGLRVFYAIADVGAFVARGGSIEAEAWLRGTTAYAPDVRATVYPESLTDGAISLLPDGERPAILFTADLDATGATIAFAVERATVRSRRRLSYAEAAAEGMPLLERLGALREALARARGATQLDLPAQEIVAEGSTPCGFRLRWEERLPIEEWNAHVSLLVGMGAAAIMVDAGVGVLRTMPEPDPARLALANASLPALWPVARLMLLRRAMGRAGYTAFTDGAPAEHRHAAIAGDYAHVTAPLRRLADRYVLDLLCTLAGGGRPTATEAATLLRLPAVMAAADARAGRLERRIIDAAEVRTLEHRVGERFAAVVMARDEHGAQVQISDPPILARIGKTTAEPGSTVHLRLTGVDPLAATLQLADDDHER